MLQRMTRRSAAKRKRKTWNRRDCSTVMTDEEYATRFLVLVRMAATTTKMRGRGSCRVSVSEKGGS
ncbi:hypothetical protein TSUD_295910 [Trifolium subterraneum]|uniref:Uncharacterized protein n=1 Tax=Trifolium subterraneum TaxID=3900 RepID=A0A2Z6N213_TRISU|nr:hypothetical protein TSUD_295910 [Trifolium subterraneum]